ncbi:MAG: hypothetical protein ACK5M1_11125 [Xanthomarina gelatinilytica]|uniref:hypothetical protein n=1 Tax=Xanthomarina gelatinilytica TaxID=1137281 RepID=UPI003A887A0D
MDNYSIMLVGSNKDIEDINELKEEKSDLDVIVLNTKSSYQYSTSHYGINIDISYVNYRDIIGLIYAAIKGSFFAGKIFSSIVENHNIIKSDLKCNAGIFVEVFTIVYKILERTYLPDNIYNHIYFHNIKSSLNDLDRLDTVEGFFTQNKLHSQIFEFMSRLNYPFQTRGAFRGKVLKKTIGNFQNIINIDESGNYMIDHFLFKNYVKKFSATTKQNYIAFTYDECMKEKIASDRLDSYYFGYDDLIQENTIVFLPEKEIKLESNNLKSRLVNLSNLVPYFTEEQLECYINILKFISKNYFSSQFTERINLFNYVWSEFCGNGFKSEINNSLKGLILKKTIFEMHKNGKNINYLDLKKWLVKVNNSSLFNHKTTCNVSMDVKKEISKIIALILNFEIEEEKNIVVNYVFFGILKALRIDTMDLFDKN